MPIASSTRAPDITSLFPSYAISAGTSIPSFAPKLDSFSFTDYAPNLLVILFKLA